MKQMHELFNKILSEGFTHPDRTGVGRISIYNQFLEFDVSEYLPISTTQKIFTTTAIKELLWMLSGSTKIDDPGLEQHIWKQWAVTDKILCKELLQDNLRRLHSTPCEYVQNKSTRTDVDKYHNSIGYIYPSAWRAAPSSNIFTFRKDKSIDELPSDLVKTLEINDRDDVIYANYLYHKKGYDQINEVFQNLKKRPYSSRHRVTSWIPEWLPDEDESPQYNVINERGALTPCHSFFQFTVGALSPNTNKPTINLYLYQGSLDAPVGGWYNILSYSILLHMFAHLLDMTANKFSWAIGDAHIYTNQIELVKEQLLRPIKEQTSKLIIHGKHIDPFDFNVNDLEICGYFPPEHIKYPVAV